MRLVSLSLICGVLGLPWTTCQLVEASKASKAPGLYGYYEVRENAHTFWWLLAASDESTLGLSDKPLVLWLQGGPGASGTGFGNFEEIGPYSVGWQPRQNTWAEKANLLFVDSPVGTGFSYVTSNQSFATNNSMIAADLTSFLRQFLDEHNAHDHPLYIFSESYGGKVCAGFAERILQEQHAGTLKVNLRGIALGDSWISPLDYVVTWGPFLKAWSLLDDYQLTQLIPIVAATQDAMASGNLTGATRLWGLVEERIGNLTDNVDWYNALLHNIPDTEASTLWAAPERLPGKQPRTLAGQRMLQKHHTDPLTKFMREDVTKRLGIIPPHVEWGSQASDVFEQLAGDFMVDSISSVDAVLASGLPVAIYNGQLDLICSTLGLDAWLPRLQWKYLEDIQSAKPEPIYSFSSEKGKTTGFVRRYNNLSIFIILNAGHMIPSDQPEAALDMLSRILSGPSPEVVSIS